MAGFFSKLFRGFGPGKITGIFDKEKQDKRYGRCRYCGRKIFWMDLKSGQRWPLDVNKRHCFDEEGNSFLAYIPHFETCRKWRKRAK